MDTARGGGRGRSCYCFRNGAHGLQPGPPVPLRSSWKMSTPVCSVCVRVDAVPSWDGPCQGTISSLLPYQRTISLHTSLGNSLDRSGCSHADALEPLTDQVGPGCWQPPSPRCVSPEGLGRELRPAHNQSPSQPKPDTRLLPCSPLL